MGIKEFVRKVREDLGVELARDLAKGALMTVGGVALTFILSGLGEITWSLRSFNWFGAVNSVDAANQNLADDAVYRLPLGTNVRLDGRVFLSVVHAHKDDVTVSVVAPDGKRVGKRLEPPASIFFDHDCQKLGIHLMEPHKEQDKDALVLYTNERLDTEDCRGFW